MGDDDPLPDVDPFQRLGLREIHLEDKPVFDLFFSCCRDRLSDYTFANTYIWRDSIHLRWSILHDCLCVFANGDASLTLLFPPIGRGDFHAAVRESLAICEEYNARAGLGRTPRIEYVSQELRERFSGEFTAEPMSGDYVYRTQRMIDLAGGDLASKRQARNRFARRYEARTEAFEPRHLPPCLELLSGWQEQAERSTVSLLSVHIKRNKEIVATADAMAHSRELGLAGMVLYAGERLVGFTFGEMLERDVCSIVIEKTDREFTGSAQYIFSEFCRQYWPHTTWCNVGDDWDVPPLAWTKESYRPESRVPKWVIRKKAGRVLCAGNHGSVI
jgi:hypothetical protein